MNRIIRQIRVTAKAISASLASAVGLKVSFEASLPDGATIPWYGWIAFLLFVYFVTYQVPNKSQT